MENSEALNNRDVSEDTQPKQGVFCIVALRQRRAPARALSAKPGLLNFKPGNIKEILGGSE